MLTEVIFMSPSPYKVVVSNHMFWKLRLIKFGQLDLGHTY